MAETDRPSARRITLRSRWFPHKREGQHLYEPGSRGCLAPGDALPVVHVRVMRLGVKQDASFPASLRTSAKDESHLWFIISQGMGERMRQRGRGRTSDDHHNNSGQGWPIWIHWRVRWEGGRRGYQGQSLARLWMMQDSGRHPLGLRTFLGGPGSGQIPQPLLCPSWG